MYGTPNDLILHSVDIYTNSPNPSPKNPDIYAKAINKNLDILKWKPNEKSGIAKEAIPVIAIIIIKIGLTMFALTAAWPRTNAPTIPIVGPIGEGTLRPASRMSSKEISISNSSNIIGKGTFCLDATIENSSSVGISSWWKFVTPTHIPGSNNVKNNDIPLIILKKFANAGFRFVSSGEDIKSIKVAGMISTYGFPFTITTTLPSNKCFVALSGLSVAIITGIP